MKIRLGIALVALPLAFQVAWLVSHAQEALPDGEGKNVVERVCTECHGTDEITSIKRTPDQWRRVVKDMLDRRDPKTSDEEAKQIIEYLIAHFSRPDGVQARDDLLGRLFTNVGGSSRRIRSEKPSAGRKNAAPAYRHRTRRGDPSPTPCRRPAQRFSCDRDGLLQRLFSANAPASIDECK
jgi:hypothetical protein